VTALRAQQPQPAPATAGRLEVIEVRPTFYMIAGAGGNIGVQLGSDGPVIVDSGLAESAQEVVAAIKALTRYPIRYVIATGPDAEHVGGNEILAKAGQTILNIGGGIGAGMTNNGAATIVGHERVLARMSAPTGEAAPFPTGAWPTETFFERRRYMYFNGEPIEILHQPAAHTDGDSVVFFRRSDVVMAGDIVDYTRFPVIDVARGGSVQGEIDALNRLVDLAVPSIPLIWRTDGTRVVPGHGRHLGQVDVADYRDMVTIIRDRVQDMIDRKMTLEQVKAAAPTQGWTRRWGADSGPWTTDKFVEAVYTSLTQGERK
jgi:glyoxylase-like metal-dependent hydrolase (beta-lactamase superfamily II)